MKPPLAMQSSSIDEVLSASLLSVCAKLIDIAIRISPRRILLMHEWNLRIVQEKVPENHLQYSLDSPS